MWFSLLQHVQILLLAQSADTLNISLWRIQSASLLYHTLCSVRNGILLTGIKDHFHELLSSVTFGCSGFLMCVCFF